MGWDGIVQLEGTFRDQWIYSTPAPKPWITSLNTADLELGPEGQFITQRSVTHLSHRWTEGCREGWYQMPY